MIVDFERSELVAVVVAAAGSSSRRRRQEQQAAAAAAAGGGGLAEPHSKGTLNSKPSSGARCRCWSHPQCGFDPCSLPLRTKSPAGRGACSIRL